MNEQEKISSLKDASWHEKHQATMSPGQRLSDNLANSMGSWKFIIWQTILIVAWITLNLVAWFDHWDPYPFILLNLLFSTQAAYSAPIIMMAQNRQNERDRFQAKEDYITNKKAKAEIEELQLSLARIETEKLEKILQILQSK
jgi:Predicted membrane protein